MRLFMVRHLVSDMGRKQNGPSQGTFALPEAGKPVNLTVSPAQIPRADSHTSSEPCRPAAGLAAHPWVPDNRFQLKGKRIPLLNLHLKNAVGQFGPTLSREGFL